MGRVAMHRLITQAVLHAQPILHASCKTRLQQLVPTRQLPIASAKKVSTMHATLAAALAARCARHVHQALHVMVCARHLVHWLGFGGLLTQTLNLERMNCFGLARPGTLVTALQRLLLLLKKVLHSPVMVTVTQETAAISTKLRSVQATALAPAATV